jgi:hypothetical protein
VSHRETAGADHLGRHLHWGLQVSVRWLDLRISRMMSRRSGDLDVMSRPGSQETGP